MITTETANELVKNESANEKVTADEKDLNKSDNIADITEPAQGIDSAYAERAS